jgi:hypothetical protein
VELTIYHHHSFRSTATAGSKAIGTHLASEMYKLRSAMGQRDDCCALQDMIEIDDAFFETETSKPAKQNSKEAEAVKSRPKLWLQLNQPH